MTDPECEHRNIEARTRLGDDILICVDCHLEMDAEEWS